MWEDANWGRVTLMHILGPYALGIDQGDSGISWLSGLGKTQ